MSCCASSLRPWLVSPLSASLRGFQRLSDAHRAGCPRRWAGGRLWPCKRARKGSFAGGYIKRLPADPWGNDYVLVNPGEHGAYDLLSAGPDGEMGTEDDITNWGLSKKKK